MTCKGGRRSSTSGVKRRTSGGSSGKVEGGNSPYFQSETRFGLEEAGSLLGTAGLELVQSALLP